MTEINKSNKRNRTFDVAICGLFVALLAVCSWISIPLTVPVTLQTFAVFLCAGLLGTKRSVIAIGCWILMGFVGVPVFAGFQGGPGVIFGPLGGYIVGFVITAIIVGLVSERISRKPIIMGVSMFIGLVICYAIGTVWFIYFYSQASGPIGVMATLGMCVFPFVIPDVLKLILAVILTKRLEKVVCR